MMPSPNYSEGFECEIKDVVIGPRFFWQRLELFKVITSNFYGENEKT